uniref:Putative secreted protein n=1 Tax=Anopheles darlingi TaxID=43151 RepID=A0A2M4D5W9_ANODA
MRESQLPSFSICLSLALSLSLSLSPLPYLWYAFGSLSPIVVGFDGWRELVHRAPGPMGRGLIDFDLP